MNFTVQLMSYYFKRIFINDLIDGSVQLISQQQGYAERLADWR